MNRLILFCLFFALSFHGFAQGFIKTFGGNAIDFGSAAVQTADGGFAIGSISESFGQKTLDMLLTRTDFEGKVLWNKTFGGNFTDQCFDITNAPDGGFVLAGYTDPDGLKNNNQCFVVKTDANGNEIWARKFGNPKDDKANAIATTKLGNYVGVGQTFNGTDYDAYVFVLDSKGQLLWTFSTGGVGDQDARDVVEVADGYVFVGVTKTTDVLGKDDRNVLLSKISKSGTPMWYKTYGGVDLDEGNALALMPDGGFIVAGRTKKNVDILALRTDSEGGEIWSKSFGGNFEDEAYGVVVNSDASIVMAGSQATDAINIDAYLLKLDLNGNKIWSQNIGKTNSQAIENFNDIIATSDGGYFMTGTVSDVIVSDIYYVKTNGNGTAASGLIKGKVFFDKTANCKFDNGEPVLSDWLVSITSKKQNYLAYTKANGEFSIAVDTGKYDVNLLVQNSYWKKVCQTSFTANVDTQNDTVSIDFPVRSAVSCPSMEVNVSSPKLTRCAKNTYTVSFCNRGTEIALNSYIIIELDEYFDDIVFNLAGVQALGNNKYKCNIGNVPPGICGKFTILATLDKNCNTTVLGQTHTVAAHIYPDSICTSPNAIWDGSSLEVSGVCKNNKVIFTVKNVGKNKSTPKNGLIIIEDIVYKVQKISINSLDPNATQEITFDAKGETFRLSVEQAAGHPGKNYPTVAIEACGGNGTFSTGYVLQFNENDGDPFVSICKLESGGLANKTEKIGFPKGFSKDRFVSDSTVIDYQISFKNNYGKTVEKVVVIDTISPYLDPTSIHEVLTSHPFELTFLTPNVLQFTFDKIFLPDSAANTLGANGFVKFKLLQKTDKSDGVVIYNNAKVHFDAFNPTFTNKTKHTVNKSFINFIKTISTYNPEYQHVSIKVYPNPFADMAMISLEGEDFGELQFDLYDMLGQRVKAEKFSGNDFEFYRDGISAGVYIFNIRSTKGIIKSGRIVIQ